MHFVGIIFFFRARRAVRPPGRLLLLQAHIFIRVNGACSGALEHVGVMENGSSGWKNVVRPRLPLNLWQSSWAGMRWVQPTLTLSYRRSGYTTYLCSTLVYVRSSTILIFIYVAFYSTTAAVNIVTHHMHQHQHSSNPS